MSHWRDTRFDFRSSPRYYKNARCNCCNSVSAQEIASDTGEYTANRFFEDPHTSGFLCYECYSSFAEQMEEYDDVDSMSDEEFEDA